MSDQLSLDFMALAAIAAPIIAGRKCLVKFKAPATKGSYGSVTVKPDGIPEVRISPNLGDKTINTYLHELAHIRLGHTDQMTRSQLDQAAPRSVTVSEADRRPTWEEQVDEQVKYWLAYGKAHADPSKPQSEGIIWALLDHYTNQER